MRLMKLLCSLKGYFYVHFIRSCLHLPVLVGGWTSLLIFCNFISFKPCDIFFKFFSSLKKEEEALSDSLAKAEDDIKKILFEI